MKRRPLSAKSSRRIFRKGAKSNPRNGVSSVRNGVMRGGIRL